MKNGLFKRYMGVGMALAMLIIAGCGGGQKSAEPSKPAASGSSSGSQSLPVPVPPAPTPKKFRIGFSNGFSGNSWRAMMLESLKQEAAKHPDIQELIIVDGQGDINKQVADIESLIAQKVDAILVIPNSGSAVAPAVRKATQAKIVTVPFNLPVDGDDYTAYLGTNPCKKGTALAEWLSTKLGNQGNIIGLGGIPGNSYTAEAWGCAQKVFAKTSIKILAFKDAHWQEDRAKVVTADLLAAHPKIDGVWCDGGQNCTGALKAFQAAGRPLVPVTGDDYNGLLKLYLANKEKNQNFDFGVMSEPTYESKLALQTALKILRGEQVNKIVTISPPLLTGKDAQKFVLPDMPDGVFFDNDVPKEKLKEIFKSQG